jgi:hypothetical protein
LNSYKSLCVPLCLPNYLPGKNSYDSFNFTIKSRSNNFKMQAKTMNEHELVQQCMTELSTKAGFAGSASMVQRDLEFLSESIESKTGVLISLSTMKRLFNGQFSRLPQIATLNAISQFLGYQHWQDFKLGKMSVKEPVTTYENDQKRSALHRRFSSARFLLFAGVLVILALGLLAMLQLRKSKTGGFEKAQFSFNKTTSNDLPNTVVFHYNIDDVNADSFFIQQSWDKNRRVRIYKNSYTLTDIYYEPGYHIAKLIANDQVIKTQDVSIPTGKWFFYAKEKIPRSVPKYIIALDAFKNGSLGLTKTEVVTSQVDIQKEQQYVYVYFPMKIESSSDNFQLKCRVRVNALNNNFCSYLMCEVFCQRNFMYFINTPKGCASEIKAQFGENYLNGKTKDLSALGTDVSGWQNIELTVKNKKAVILINNAEVFSAGYSQTSGLITGLGFISNGLPEVDLVELKTLDGKNIYSHQFEE